MQNPLRRESIAISHYRQWIYSGNEFIQNTFQPLSLLSIVLLSSWDKRSLANSNVSASETDKPRRFASYSKYYSYHRLNFVEMLVIAEGFILNELYFYLLRTTIPFCLLGGEIQTDTKRRGLCLWLDCSGTYCRCWNRKFLKFLKWSPNTTCLLKLS